ncbi:NmrA/HSCARG family protein [Sphaerisporangium perillae]|uniref:NmrA/HSCARG family protein n=1 Tax=Sphaerisporangium perillae TaxID=2935860 RepID=UPI00200C9DE4|nr:NmrA/HSCARG family protein [Sphaerisporangium perillae]
MAHGKGPVLVIGATGQQGGAAARELLERGWAVHALVRDPGKPAATSLRQAGAELVTGELDDPASLRAAMASVHGVFLVLTMMTGPRVTLEGVAAEERRGKAVADLARETGVAHLVYSSSAGANLPTGVPHLASKGRIEEHIRALELPATVLRPAFFMDNFASLTRPVLTGDELVVSLALRPEARMPLIATRDIGAFAAIAFDRPERYLGRDVEIAGDDLTCSGIAETFGRVRDRPARFQQVPIERVRAFDEEVAKMFAWLDRRATVAPDLPALREDHPGLMTLETWLRKTAWTPAGEAEAR